MYLFGNSSLLENLALYAFIIALLGCALILAWISAIEIKSLIKRVKSEKLKRRL